MKYYLIVGEVLGDLYVFNLMCVLIQEDLEVEFCFFGGDLMMVVGGMWVKYYKELVYMGFILVLLYLCIIFWNMKECKQDIVCWIFDVVILVDYFGFNLKIVEFIKKQMKIFVYYYIFFKIWVWKEYRIKNIKWDVDELFFILFFEVEFFVGYQYFVYYVGNFCVDVVDVYCKEYLDGFLEFVVDNGLFEKFVIVLLVGSWKQEIKDNLLMMLEVVVLFIKDY